MAERAPAAERLPEAYFEELYERDGDPWEFASSAYEDAKYEATLAALGPSERRFRSAFEAGCSIGVFTARLAPRCDELLAVDLSPLAVEGARRRLDGLRHVRVERRALPEELPARPFDVVVLSEILYYWSPRLLMRSLARLERLVGSGGSLVAVHWRPRTRTYPQLGDEVHDLLTEGLTGLEHPVAVINEHYRLDRWDRPA